MFDGEISFLIDGKNCGVASKDKRLKQGKYYAAILLLGKKDRVTLTNPRKVMESQLGYELLLAKLNIVPADHERFFHLLEMIQEYFMDETQDKHMHRLIICSYLNNYGAFEQMCNVIKSKEEEAPV